MNKQKGFSIVMAIFILIVLALLGSYMVKLTGVQHSTSLSVLQGVRAYQAAKAGIEWGVYQVVNGSCTASSTVTLPSGMNGFSVNVTCSNQGVAYNEGDLNSNAVNDDDFYVYLITSSASYGSFTDSDYVYRQLKVTVKN